MAWVIYHLDHGIQFSRNHGAFHYEYGGKIRRYYPDFIVAGVYIEVKGFDSPQFQAKLACFHNQIQVLYEKDMQPIFEYVRSTYGNDLSSLYDKDGE